MSSYISFVLLKDSGRTKIYNVVSRSSDVCLGQIKWHGPWRQYVFFPAANTLWSQGCIQEVRAFIDELMAARSSAVAAPVPDLHFRTAMDVYKELGAKH